MNERETSPSKMKIESKLQAESMQDKETSHLDTGTWTHDSNGRMMKKGATNLFASPDLVADVISTCEQEQGS